MTRDQLAGKEMNVGRYYLEKRNYTAAVNRFRWSSSSTRHAPCRGALMRLYRGPYGARHHQRGADRRRGARAQLPG